MAIIWQTTKLRSQRSAISATGAVDSFETVVGTGALVSAGPTLAALSERQVNALSAAFTSQRSAVAGISERTVKTLSAALAAQAARIVGQVADVVLSNEFTHEWVDLGTKAALAPLFARTFDNTTQGQLATAIGYYQSGGPAAYVDMADGYMPGAGCLRWDSGAGSSNGFMFNQFGHIAVGGLNETQLFEMVAYKPNRTQGSGNYSSVQQKNLREASTPEYSGTPRTTTSLYCPSDFMSISYTNQGYFKEDGSENASDDGGVSATYKTRYAAARSAGKWVLQEKLSVLNTLGQSNGYSRLWVCGSLVPLTAVNSNVQYRITDKRFNFASLLPGLDNFVSGDQYTFKFAEHIIDNTPARMVLGNASTWDACTEKLYLFVTQFSGGVAKAPKRKFPGIAPGASVWSYCVNNDGTVSPSKLQVAI